MKIAIVINLVFSTFFWWLFYQRYYKYQHLFENGRYFDGEQVFTDNNVVYVLPATFFLLVAGILLLIQLGKK